MVYVRAVLCVQLGVFFNDIYKPSTYALIVKKEEIWLIFSHQMMDRVYWVAIVITQHFPQESSQALIRLWG